MGVEFSPRRTLFTLFSGACIPCLLKGGSVPLSVPSFKTYKYRPLLKPSLSTLRKLCFHFLSNRMGYDRGDSSPFDFEPNGMPFGSKSKGKLSPRSYPIQCDRKWKYSFLSVLRGKIVLLLLCWVSEIPLNGNDLYWAGPDTQHYHGSP